MTVDLLRPKGNANAWTWEVITRKFFCTATISGNAQASEHVHDVAAGILPNDVHIDKVGVTLETNPGDGKTVTITVSDGVAVMTVAVADTATSGSTVTGNYDWDVSDKPLEIRISADNGTNAGCCSIVVTYHEVTI